MISYHHLPPEAAIPWPLAQERMGPSVRVWLWPAEGDTGWEIDARGKHYAETEEEKSEPTFNHGREADGIRAFNQDLQISRRRGRGRGWEQMGGG